MHRYSLATLLVSFLLVACESSAATPGKITKDQFTYGGRTLSYYLFVPKEATAPASTPLLVLFHGSGRDGSSLIEPWKKLAEKEGIVLLAPDSQNRQGWDVPLDGPELLCALVDHVRQSWPVINARRTYLFGHSAGGVFVLFISMLESEYFAAGAVHAGAWRAPGDFGFVGDLVGRKIPMALTVGDRDQFFPVADVRATEAALAKAGVPVKTHVIAGHDHNYYVTADKVNEWAWSALKEHALERDPHYIVRQFRQ
jgi:poly(3-hydroxybutyrate) depolymerase